MQKICVIIPCYNEEHRLMVNMFNDFYHKDSSLHFCFVNDGSKDKTMDLLNAIQQGKDRVHLINKKVNAGKAEAIRSSVLFLAEQQFTHIAYFDADFSAPLSEIYALQQAIAKSDTLKVAFGSRIKRLGADIERTASRHILGRVFSTIASLILRLPVYDTQCGAKMFEAKLAAQIFTEPFISKWLFDIELFARIVAKYGKNQALAMFVEVPLNQWKEIGKSKLRPTYMLKVPLELFSIYLKYKTALKKP